MLRPVNAPGAGEAAHVQAAGGAAAASPGQRLFTSQRAMSPVPPGLRISAHGVTGGVESPDGFLIAPTSQRTGWQLIRGPAWK